MLNGNSAFLYGSFAFKQALVATIIGDFLVAATIYFLLRRPIADVKALAEEQHKLRERTAYLKELNNSVFKRWKNVSVSSVKFRIDVKMDEVDSDMFSKAEEFLSSENDETRSVLETWKHLEISKRKYNEIGEKVRKAITNHLSESYPSLKDATSSEPNPKENCYVTVCVVKFVECKLQPIILKKESIDWNKMIPDPFLYEDVRPKMWSLEPYGVHIQSENKNDVNREDYQNAMKNLIPKIDDNLRQLDITYGKINSDLKIFREKMNILSNGIELHLSLDGVLY